MLTIDESCVKRTIRMSLVVSRTICLPRALLHSPLTRLRLHALPRARPRRCAHPPARARAR